MQGDIICKWPTKFECLFCTLSKIPNKSMICVICYNICVTLRNLPCLMCSVHGDIMSKFLIVKEKNTISN